MAKAKLASILSDLSGKEGNSVFTRSKGSLNVRQRVTPRNPRTVAQVAARASFSASSKVFAAMASNVAASWEAYAKTISIKDAFSGTSYSPSGIDAFKQLADVQQSVAPGDAIITTVPTGAPVFDNLTITAAISGLVLTMTAGVANSTNVLEQFAFSKRKSRNSKAPKTRKPFGTKHFLSSSLTSSFTLLPGIYDIYKREVETVNYRHNGYTYLGTFVAA